MARASINRTVLMSGADYFDDAYPINPYMDDKVPVNRLRARAELSDIRTLLIKAGVNVLDVPAPVDCQDGVYTANWGLCRGKYVVLSRLPNSRQAEEPYAEKIMRKLGRTVIKPPVGMRFSGQGDALPCGDLLFIGTTYRTDTTAHQFVAEALGYKPVSLQTIPKADPNSPNDIASNPVTGWPDSYFYDIDLALAVLRRPIGRSKGMIAWCPTAFTSESRAKIQAIDAIEKIEVSHEEALGAFACNLVSTGEAVVMSNRAPHLQKELEQNGFTIYSTKIEELIKGGGYIRCTTLTLDNV